MATAQWSPGSTVQTSLTQSGLTPGSSYVLLVRAYKNNSDGTRSYSDYASIPYTDSGVAPSGLNPLATNNGTDILLNGGSIFAQSVSNPFPSNIGKFNVVTGSTSGTGLILNSSGVAAFNNGTKEFYIDASRGKAYFAGTLVAASGTFSGSLSAASGTFTGNLSGAGGTFSGTMSAGTIISPIFSTNNNTAAGITNNSSPRFYISYVEVPSNWESTAAGVQITMDPGDTSRYDTVGGIELVRDAIYQSFVTMWAPYSNSYKQGAARITLQSAAGAGSAAISMQGAVIVIGSVATTAANTSPTTIMDLRRIMVQTGSLSSYPASSYSAGDILLMY